MFFYIQLTVSGKIREPPQHLVSFPDHSHAFPDHPSVCSAGKIGGGEGKEDMVNGLTSRCSRGMWRTLTDAIK